MNLLVELGSAYIKLGQLLSVRPDVLPQPYIEEFSKLQDEVPPAPFEEFKIIIEQQLGRPISEVFDSFDKDAVNHTNFQLDKCSEQRPEWNRW